MARPTQSSQQLEVQALRGAIRDAKEALNALKRAMRKSATAHRHALEAGGAVGAYTFSDERFKKAEQALDSARAKLIIKRDARQAALNKARAGRP